MILLDSRVASLRYRLLLADFSKSNREVQFVFPSFSLAHLCVCLFTLATIPIMLLIAVIEVTRTRQNILTTISMIIPVFITRSSVSNIVEKKRKFHFRKRARGDDGVAENNFYALPKYFFRESLVLGFSSPLLPFNTFFPMLASDEYILLIAHKDLKRNNQLGTEMAKLTYLPSVADTYENILCHYFNLLKRNNSISLPDSRFMLTCGGKISNPLVILKLFGKRFMADNLKILRILFLKKNYTWYVRVQIGDSSTTQTIIDLENPENGYYADPFLFEFENEIYLFVEEYTFSTSKGVVCVFKFHEDKFERLGICLEEIFHLSFPNVFVDGKDIYMMPESSENRDVRLYRAVDFPLKWELATQLLTNVSAVDSIIYKGHQDYFLLTTEDIFNVGDYATNLSLYSSPQIVSSDWFKSKHNPIIIDSEKGRNAGRFDLNPNLKVRIAQASQFGTYGKKIRLFEIQNLSINTYSEIEMNLPELDIPLDSQGHHHLSSIKHFKAFDFSRFER